MYKYPLIYRNTYTIL